MALRELPLPRFLNQFVETGFLELGLVFDLVQVAANTLTRRRFGITFHLVDVDIDGDGSSSRVRIRGQGSALAQWIGRLLDLLLQRPFPNAATNPVTRLNGTTGAAPAGYIQHTNSM
jgi:hypothetical protein